ncbi:GNAT family N-acetyltransferase [Prosthecomicrobium sp. N25]|uniref:GNAT family N-acetyltransferase n=1 Tax=Prosthecomicrobium sp. N25 TaxID=3129254 RepID=UPI00307711CD
MTALIRPARPEECEAVAGMVRTLARDTGAETVPAVTGETLRAEAFGASPLLRLWVAEADGRLVGMLVGVVAFSTWRGGRGLYVCDLYAEPARRGSGLGRRLLAAAARAARDEGLSYMKLEIIGTNQGVARFYARLGFEPVEGDVTWVLERDGLDRLAAG